MEIAVPQRRKPFVHELGFSGPRIASPYLECSQVLLQGHERERNTSQL